MIINTIIVIVMLNTAAIIATLVVIAKESRRRYEAEGLILEELNKALQLIKEDLGAKMKLVEGWRFLIKRSHFHKWLIDQINNRMNNQEDDFVKFGSFIAELRRISMPRKGDTKHSREDRIDALTKEFWMAGKE